MSGKHLTRKELIDAARKRTVTEDEHLNDCSDCRETVALLETFKMIGQRPLQAAPAGWVEKAVALVPSTSVVGKVRQMVAKLVFDSWSVAQPVGVRGQATQDERRVRFETAGLAFDLRAERQDKSWGFVAQVTKDSETVSSIILKADRMELSADREGLYQWTSSKPPRKMSLRSKEMVVDIPELTWKRPQLT